MDINAGFYFVRGNERTRRLFQMMLDYILADATVWDQSLMSCLMKRESPVPYLSIRSGCDRKGITTADLNASSIIKPLNVPAWPIEPHYLATKHSRHVGLLGGGAEEPDTGRFSFAVLGNDVVVSAPFPFIFHQTVAVHVLTDKPLTSAHGKKMVIFPSNNIYHCIVCFLKRRRC